jgi:hypothetical protein
MAKRYIGDATINITYRDRGDYAGTISAGGHTWRFEDLRPAPVGFGRGIAYDSSQAYDEMARSAATFGGYYSSSNRGSDTPDWAPPSEVADAIDEATSWAMDEEGTYEVRRSKGSRDNPQPWAKVFG